jgi:NADH:ubiquinone oxidoreductase subunit 6 (subunit J)
MIFTKNNMIACTLSLATVLFFSTIILILSHVEFLSYVFILIYVGGIAILFLFIIIMLNIKVSKENKTNSLVSSLLSGFILLIFILIKVQNSISNFVQKSFFSSNYYLNKTGSLPNLPIDDVVPKILSNDILLFGTSLYSSYFFYFLLLGVILLVVMVIVLVLALPTNKPVNPYNANRNKNLLPYKNFSSTLPSNFDK